MNDLNVAQEHQIFFFSYEMAMDSILVRQYLILREILLIIEITYSFLFNISHDVIRDMATLLTLNLCHLLTYLLYLYTYLGLIYDPN